DRPGAVAGVLRQCRLAGRGGHRRRIGCVPDGAAPCRPAPCRAGKRNVSRGPSARLWRAVGLTLCFCFLYLPIAVLVAYSFNGSRLVTVWGGFSTKWYGVLLENSKFAAAALTSFEIAVMAATIALIVGTCAGLAISRFRRFRGRALFSFM